MDDEIDEARIDDCVTLHAPIDGEARVFMGSAGEDARARVTYEIDSSGVRVCVRNPLTNNDENATLLASIDIPKALVERLSNLCFVMAGRR